MLKKYNGFTLVELIVTIGILAVLATIAFISLGNFTVTARDSTRISDVKSIEQTLENFSVHTGRFPIPSDYTSIVYSGAIVFQQGVFGESMRVNVREINKVPLDPLYDIPYDYSVSSTKRSYNLAWLLEGQLTTYNGFITETNAEEREVVSKVLGNYNGQISHTSTGGIIYVFSAPSLIVSDLSNTNILSLTDKFVFDDQPNLSASYSGKAVPSGVLSFKPSIVYSGTTLPSTPESLKRLVDNLKLDFDNPDHPTALYSNSAYKSLIEMNTGNSEELFIYGKDIINTELGGRFKLVYKSSCRDILHTDDNIGSGEYTISPDGVKKLKVYCDMETDGGGWTRLKKWEEGMGYTDLKTTNDTRGISGSEVLVKYKRNGKIRVDNGSGWEDLDVSGKQYGFVVNRFNFRQHDENGLCAEKTGISSLVGHLTSGSWGTCNRNCYRGGNPEGSCVDYNGESEYLDIIMDDLGETGGFIAGIGDDKHLTGFDDDPCLSTGHKNSYRNLSWSDSGYIQSRIDDETSILPFMGSNAYRCNGVHASESRLEDRINEGSTTTSSRGITSGNYMDYVSGLVENETYVR